MATALISGMTARPLATNGGLKAQPPRRTALWAAPVAAPSWRQQAQLAAGQRMVARASVAEERVGMTMADFEELLKATPTPVLVDFYTSWCGPCKFLAKNMAILEPTWKDRVAFEKIDAEKNYAVAKHYNVSKLPTLLLFKGGNATPAQRFEGLLSTQDLELWLLKNLK